MFSETEWAILMRYIPQWEIDSEWTRLLPMLKMPLDRQTAFDEIGLYAMLKRGEMQLWDAVDAALVTQIQTYQLERICMLVLAGGTNLDNWKRDMLDMIVRYAKFNGCKALCINGRAGWSRIVPEFNVTDTVMRMNL